MEHPECRHEADFIRIQREHEDLALQARSHVTWTVFWSVIILLVGIATTVFGTIVAEKNGVHKDLEAKIAELSKDNNETRVAYARIETSLAQIQKDLADLKLRK